MSKVFQKYNCCSKARCTATLLPSAAGKSKHHSTTVLCHLVAVSEMTPNARPKEQMTTAIMNKAVFSSPPPMSSESWDPEKTN